MIELQPINETFVADITDLDVRHISDADFDDIYAAWLHFGVLRLRNQPLDEDELQAFSARFGLLEEVPVGKRSVEDQANKGNRYVLQLSNIMVGGKPIGGLGNAEANWHSDMTYRAPMLGRRLEDAA